MPAKEGEKNSPLKRPRIISQSTKFDKLNVKETHVLLGALALLPYTIKKTCEKLFLIVDRINCSNWSIK